MRNATSFVLAASIALFPSLAAADEPAAPAPVTAPAPAAALLPARTIVYVREDGTALTDAPATRLRNPKLALAGAISAAAGLAGLIGGIAMVQSITPTPSVTCSKKDFAAATYLLGTAGAEICVAGALASSYDLRAAPGIALATVGGVALAGGVVMAVVGGMTVTRPTRKQQAAGVPTVTVGPTSGSLRWSF